MLVEVIFTQCPPTLKSCKFLGGGGNVFAKVENILHQYIIGTKGWVPRGTATNHLYLHCGELHLGVGSYF